MLVFLEKNYLRFKDNDNDNDNDLLLDVLGSLLSWCLSLCKPCISLYQVSQAVTAIIGFLRHSPFQISINDNGDCSNPLVKLSSLPAKPSSSALTSLDLSPTLENSQKSFERLKIPKSSSGKITHKTVGSQLCCRLIKEVEPFHNFHVVSSKLLSSKDFNMLMMLCHIF